MVRHHSSNAADNLVVWVLLLLNALILKEAYLFKPDYYWCLVVTAPLFVMALFRLRVRRPVRPRASRKIIKEARAERELESNLA